MHSGPIPPPQQPSRLLFDSEYLSLSGMGVHPPVAANGNVLESTLVSANPFDFEWRPCPLIVSVRTGHITEVGEPVIFGIGQFTAERTANLPQLQFFLRQRSLTFWAEDVQITILTAEIYFSVAHGNRSGNRLSEGGLKRPYFTATGQRHYVKAAVQAAIDSFVV